jgi:polygalacturonase
MTNRRELMQGAMNVAFAGALPASSSFAKAFDPWDRAAWIMESIEQTSFPKRDFDIAEFGARSSGTEMNTAAFARAIDAAHGAGGGRVLVPAGTWLTGAIHLKSNVNLHVTEDATIRFSTDPKDYPIVFTRWEGIELMNYSPLIYAKGQENIAVTGQGTLDGQASAQHWWSWKGPWGGTVEHGWKTGMVDQLPARAKLFKMAEEFVPVEERVFGEGSYLRPAFIQPYDCDRVLIEGVKLRGAPFWHLHPVLSRNVIVRGVDILGHGPNNDGCDPESVSMMLIENCTFDTGDDCIAINSGRNADGRRLNTPSENIVIRNCRMKEGHGGIAVGSQISGGVHNVFAERCHMDSPNLNAAIRFKNNAMRGGFLEDFYYRDIAVGRVRSAVVCDFNYEEGAAGRYRPHLSNVVIERLTVEHASRVMNCQGLAGAPVGTITLRDCRFEEVSDPSIIEHTESVVLDDVRVGGQRVKKLA